MNAAERDPASLAQHLLAQHLGHRRTVTGGLPGPCDQDATPKRRPVLNRGLTDRALRAVELETSPSHRGAARSSRVPSSDRAVCVCPEGIENMGKRRGKAPAGVREPSDRARSRMLMQFSGVVWFTVVGCASTAGVGRTRSGIACPTTRDRRDCRPRGTCGCQAVLFGLVCVVCYLCASACLGAWTGRTYVLGRLIAPVQSR